MSDGSVATTIDEARTTILKGCKAIPGREIVLRYDSEMAKPTTPFVEVFIESAELPNGRVLTLSEDGLTETVSTLMNIAVVLNCLGGDAMDAAINLRNSLYATERTLDLYKTLGYLGVPSLRDLSFLETGHFKQRAELTINFDARIENSYASSYYESVEVNVTRG